MLSNLRVPLRENRHIYRLLRPGFSLFWPLASPAFFLFTLIPYSLFSQHPANCSATSGDVNLPCGALWSLPTPLFSPSSSLFIVTPPYHYCLVTPNTATTASLPSSSSPSPCLQWSRSSPGPGRAHLPVEFCTRYVWFFCASLSFFLGRPPSHGA